MNMQSFMYLDEIEQADLVSEKGVFMCERVEGDTIFDLYRIDAFFVEYCYFLKNDREAVCKIFNDTTRLHPYREMLQNISINA